MELLQPVISHNIREKSDLEIKGYFKNDDTNTIINYDCHGEKNSNNISFKSENDILTIDIKKDEIIFKRENDDIVMIYNLILGKTTTDNSYKLMSKELFKSLVINFTSEDKLYNARLSFTYIG